MRSLPVIDKETSRVETYAYACLGIVSLILITAAAFNGGKYAEGRDDIIASLNKRAEPAVTRVEHPNTPLAVNGNSSARTGVAAPQQ